MLEQASAEQHGMVDDVHFGGNFDFSRDRSVKLLRSMLGLCAPGERMHRRIQAPTPSVVKRHRLGEGHGIAKFGYRWTTSIRCPRET